MTIIVQDKSTVHPSVRWWLIAGIVMIFFQIVLGGITRISGSGLSITRWDIVTGTLPPLSKKSWEDAFELYKRTPQFHKINYDMSLGEFKRIFFWEYVHRLWARTMGFVFLIPFVYFYRKKMIPRWLAKRLGVVILLAAFAASLGWIMVASGLVNRPLVNAYKLSIHLSVAFLLLGYLMWTYLMASERVPFLVTSRVLTGIKALFSLISIQIVLGGIMSGMKAGMYYPSWPKMNGTWIPDILLTPSQWTLQHFVEYDAYRLMPALIQFLHRGVAYLIFGVSLLLLMVQFRKGGTGEKMMATLMFLLILLQITLGIYTVLNCLGEVPIWLGVFHQMTAILVFLTALVYLHDSRIKNSRSL